MLRAASAVLLALALGTVGGVSGVSAIREYPVPAGTVRFDPKTEKFTVYPLPSRGTHAFRILGRPGGSVVARVGSG